jgi:hypothetical protein
MTDRSEFVPGRGMSGIAPQGPAVCKFEKVCLYGLPPDKTEVET